MRVRWPRTLQCLPGSLHFFLRLMGSWGAERLSSREGHGEMESSCVCVESCPGQNQTRLPTEWTWTRFLLHSTLIQCQNWCKWNFETLPCVNSYFSWDSNYFLFLYIKDVVLILNCWNHLCLPKWNYVIKGIIVGAPCPTLLVLFSLF